MTLRALTILAFTATLISSPATAQERTRLMFRFYNGGFAVFGLEAQAELQNNQYAITTRAASEGLFDFVTRFRQEAQTMGRIDGGRLFPLSHSSRSDGRFGARSIGMEWRDGTPTIRLEPATDSEDRDPVPPALKRGAIDPLSAAILKFGGMRIGEVCAGKTDVFDGRRRYALHYEPIGMAEIAPNRYGAFTGTAQRCNVRLERMAGYSRSRENTERVDETRTVLWLGRVGRDRLLPVRLEQTGFWGNVIGHLELAELDDQAALAMPAAR